MTDNAEKGVAAAPSSGRLGARIAQFRSEQGLSQADLATKVGTSQSAISQIESGSRNPTYDMIIRIADSFDVPPGHLLGEEVGELPEEEQLFFREYRGLSETARQELRDYLNYLRSTRT
jgi:transcriptional regulator with XRE-family HTH domain